MSELKHIRLIKTDDISKLVLGYKDAKWLYDTLFYKYKIQLEMSSIKYVIAMTSIFDSQEYYDRFLAALKEIDEELDNRVLAALKEIDESRSKYNNRSKDKILINDEDNGNKVNIADFRDEQTLTIAEAFNRRDLSGCDEIQMNNEKIYGKIIHREYRYCVRERLLHERLLQYLRRPVRQVWRL